MTLTQLRAFLVSAMSGSFTAAAEELGTTQPTVSELVRKLEVETGLALFVRGGRRLKLTPAGEELLPWAQRTVDAADGGTSALQALRGITGGTVSIGVLRNAAYYFLPELIDRFRRDHPGVRLRAVGQNSAEVAAGVRSGDLEAGLVVLPIDDEGLEVSPLMRDEVLWVGRAEAARGRAMTIEEVAATEMIVYDAHYGWTDPTRRQLAERAQRAGVRLEPVIEVEAVGPALELVRRGAGETLVSSAVAASPTFPEGLGTVPFDPPLFDTIAVISRAGSTLAPATAELIRVATEMVRRLGGEL
ncbi:LysR family transcriptional regulator [Leucobacter allii]|uniref:LysR family transcriptional regulator n=1 Tax=Leucobacter allii TaxID=2932247 RepID=UPI001FD2D479|nr:LysR family transcriptional regulator [Leucobacter allii]UOR02157.1 LysR family transcriptional regulator [Leucobacter allii]